MDCLSRPYIPSNFLKDVFHRFYLSILKNVFPYVRFAKRDIEQFNTLNLFVAFIQCRGFFRIQSNI